MTSENPNDPLHGVTLKAIMEDLIARRGWDDLAANIKIRCFASDPSLKSSLKFLRKTDWARDRVEQLYLEDQRVLERKRKRNRRRAAMRAHRAEQESESPSEDPSESPSEDPDQDLPAGEGPLESELQQSIE